MSYRRNHKPRERQPREVQRFMSAALIEYPMRGVLREGSPVRVTFKRRVGAYPKGKYKGVVTAGGEGAYTGTHIVRLLVNHAPSEIAWMVGKPMYVTRAVVVVLPSKRR